MRTGRAAGQAVSHPNPVRHASSVICHSSLEPRPSSLLLQDGHAASFQELLEETCWQRYGPEGDDPRCRDCMLHSGFEASAVDEGFSSLRGFLAMARAALRGPRVPGASGAWPEPR